MMAAVPWMHNLAKILIKPLIRTLYLSSLLALFIPFVCTASGDEGLLSGSDGQSGKSVRLSIKGISASAGEDEPRVLTILPWRAPSLPRRPRAELESSAPELVQPLDPLVLERHREFRRSLGVTNSGGRSGARQ